MLHRVLLASLACVLISGPVSAQSPAATQIKVSATLLEKQGLSKNLSYYVGGFQPNYIEVRKGQRVTIQLRSVDGTHSLAIPKLGLKTAPVAAGKSAELTFVADQVGEFEIKCDSVCGKMHKKMGGTLIVTE